MPSCNECGEWVSERFHRVFSNERGELWGCLNCGIQQAGSRRAVKDKENSSVR